MTASKDANTSCIQTSWRHDAARLRAVREAVFVNEQGIDPALDFDGRDDDCQHVLVLDGERPVATARLQPDGQVGRVCVLPAYRGRGLGLEVTREAVEIARRLGMREVHLHAQVDASEMYTQLGFVVDGEVFEEAGIDHINMRRSL